MKFTPEDFTMEAMERVALAKRGYGGSFSMNEIIAETANAILEKWLAEAPIVNWLKGPLPNEDNRDGFFDDENFRFMKVGDSEKWMTHQAKLVAIEEIK